MLKIAFLPFIATALIFTWSITELTAQRDELFKITRNKDANEIIYHLNTDEHGRLILDKPIEAYWIRHDLEEEGRSLNNMERRYAYGLKFRDITANSATFHFVSFDQTLYLVQVGKQQFEVQTKINGQRMRLEEIYLSLAGGSFWFPKVNYIELRGFNEKGSAVNEKITDL